LPKEAEEYAEKLSSLTEIQISYEQRENFAELFFILNQLDTYKRNAREIRHNAIQELEYGVASMEERIQAVNEEIERRDYSLTQQLRRVRRRTPSELMLVGTRGQLN